MKKTLFIIALIYNLTFAIYNCSSQWSLVNLPVSGPIHRMQFVNQNTGWLRLSNNGNILKTTNGGVNWSVVADSSAHIYYFQFINDTLGYATGINILTPLFMKTTNGGSNWATIYYPNPNSLGSMYFIDANTGWADGFIFPNRILILKTTNGGMTFDSLSVRNGSFGGGDSRLVMLKDYPSGQYYGYHHVNGNLWKTTNSGYNWTQLGFSSYITSFSFVNKDTGWVVLNSSQMQILKTTNGGAYWILQHSDPSGLLSPLTISAINNNNVWGGIENYYYKILRTTNSGSNWGNQYCPIPWPQVVYMYDTSLGFAWNNFNNNNLVRTTNGGGPIISVGKISEEIPDAFELKQNYPNPFNPSTNIEFRVSVTSLVSVQLFDVLGKNIAVPVYETEFTPGTYRLSLDMQALRLPGGVYFCKMTAYGARKNFLFSSVKKMLYIK